MTLRIADAAVEFVGDKELEELLHRVYVVDGFTAADVGASLFAAAAVRARGKLLSPEIPAAGSPA
ncbi:MAG: hypothetical protein M5R36_24665 [Deltaproteobacteria bacterium]|nr:hypothetical protein [Deltaproteobacteria bacterium]